MKIYYLGNYETYPPKSYTFAELAAEILKNKNGNKYELIPKPSWESVVESLNSDSLAVIAYENKTVGKLKKTLDLIEKNNLIKLETIVVSVVLCAGIYPGSKEVDAVYSYQDALSQCSVFLRDNGLLNKTNPVNSTAQGTMIVKKRKSGMVIAREEALLDAGLEVIAKDISDKKKNHTKFYVVKKP